MKQKVEINVPKVLIDRLELNLNLILKSDCGDEISSLVGSCFEDIIIAFLLKIITEKNMDELAESVCEVADKRIKALN